MIRLIYVSTSTEMLVESDLLLLLSTSRERNIKQNITGMLLYCGGNFIQVLEGEKSDVEDVYSSILADKRNTDNVIIKKEEISTRSFPNWAMGFKVLNFEKKNSKEYSSFINLPLDVKGLTNNPSIVMELLYEFQENNRW